jgi:tape measure domain-containing protein
MNDNIIKILITAKDEASSVLAGLKNNASQAADASKKFAVGLAAAATATAGFIGYGAKIAGDLEASRAGFITLLGSAGEADKVLAQIKKDAASTPFELPGLIQANQLLTSVTKDGMRSEDMLLNVGKALAAMGKGQPELDRIIVNLQQIGAVGKASLMDVRQFAFAGIPIFEMLQETTGKSGDALSDFISEGGVTFELLEQMFEKTGSAGGRFADAFKNQAGTFNQLLSNMKDNVTVAMADIVQSSGIFDILKNAMAGVSDWVSANSGKISDGIKNMFVFIKENGTVISRHNTRRISTSPGKHGGGRMGHASTTITVYGSRRGYCTTTNQTGRQHGRLGRTYGDYYASVAASGRSSTRRASTGL